MYYEQGFAGDLTESINPIFSNVFVGVRARVPYSYLAGFFAGGGVCGLV